MRKSAILFTGVVVAMSLWSCDSQIGEGEISGDDEDSGEYCNSAVYTAAATGDAGSGRYIWLGLMDRDTLVIHGDSVFVSGIYQDEEVLLQVGFWNDIPANWYDLRVFASAEDSAVGKVRERMAADEAGKVLIPSFTAEENHACCTRVWARPHRKYAQLIKYLDNCTGVSAKIKARYGKPCGYPDSTNVSFNATYACAGKWVQTPSGPYFIWTQAGVGWERDPGIHGGNSDIWKYIYYETFVDGGLVGDEFYCDWQEGFQDYVNPPDDGQEWTYRCSLSTSGAEWYFTINGWDFPSIGSDPAWNEAVNTTIWASEIYNWEDDMAGTASDPCVLSELELRLGDGSFDLIIEEDGDTVFSDEPDLWHIHRPRPSEIRIWDFYPHP